MGSRTRHAAHVYYRSSELLIPPASTTHKNVKTAKSCQNRPHETNLASFVFNKLITVATFEAKWLTLVVGAKVLIRLHLQD
jgi:hypothetical protein